MYGDVRVWLVGAGPGDPTLVTVQGLELLRKADVVLYDALAHPALLEECRADARLVSVGKRYGAHTVEQAEIIAMMIEGARLGQLVVRLKGGDPFLFARGAEEAEALAQAGIHFGVVPGITSPVGTATFAGFPLTHRDLSSSVTFVTGTDKLGQPHRPEDWHRLARGADTLCILMGMRRIAEITEHLIAGGKSVDTPAAVVKWGARPEQRVVVATLSTIAERVHEQGLKNPAVIVIGDVVTLREKLRWYDSSPLFGKRLLVPRPAEQASNTARLLRARGAEPVLVPLIAIEDPEDPAAVSDVLRRLGEFDWVILTSVNGTERILAGLESLGLDARAFGRAKIGVIGPKTAEPLGRFGIRPDLVAEEHVAEGLLNELLRHEPIRRVLLFRAAEARPVLPDQLRARGIDVEVVAAYRTRRLSDRQAAVLTTALEAGIDAVLVTSSSMAEALADSLGTDAPARLSELVVASIGPVTTATLSRLGIHVDLSAKVHTIPALLDALEAHFAARRDRGPLD